MSSDPPAEVGENENATDSDLVVAFVGGDREAFADLYQRYARRQPAQA